MESRSPWEGQFWGGGAAHCKVQRIPSMYGGDAAFELDHLLSFISNGPSTRVVDPQFRTTRIYGPCLRAVNTGSAYQAPAYTGRVDKTM